MVGRAGFVHAWTAEMEALLGTAPDAKVGALIGLPEDRIRYRRRKRGIPTFRSTRAPMPTACGNCGSSIVRSQQDHRRATRLYCSRTCANAGQKIRDTDQLRYGPGWKATRDRIRARDAVCRACGTPPSGTALHVHHLVPYRMGGTNLDSNLVSLCDPCHHRIEAATSKVIAEVSMTATLENGMLRLRIEADVDLAIPVPSAG